MKKAISLFQDINHGKSGYFEAMGVEMPNLSPNEIIMTAIEDAETSSEIVEHLCELLTPAQAIAFLGLFLVSSIKEHCNIS